MPGGITDPISCPTVDSLGTKLHQTLSYELGLHRGISFLEMLSQRTTDWMAYMTAFILSVLKVKGPQSRCRQGQDTLTVLG